MRHKGNDEQAIYVPPPASSDLMRPQPRGFERGALALGHAIDREFLNRFADEPMKIELCGKVQKHSAETDRSPVHEHEFAGHPYGPFLPQRAMNLEGLASAVF